MATDLTIPEIGESVTEAFVGKWLKKPGDHVEKDEIVAELESEKANFELPAPVAGTIDEILVEEGDSAEVGDVIARITEGDAKRNDDKREKDADEQPADDEKRKKPKSDDADNRSAASKTAQQDDGKKRKEKPVKKGDAKAKPVDEGDGEQGAGDEAASPAKDADDKVSSQPRIMPAARRALSEYDLDAADVEATGPGGRLLKEDVMRHVAKARHEPDKAGADQPADTTQAKPADAPSREEQVVTMSPMRQTIARHLVEAQKTAALLTTFNEIDMSAVVDLRKAHRDRFAEVHGVKLGFMSFFVKACVDALKQYPAINASIREEKKIVYHNYYDIGIAVSTERGLVVPVVRDADQLSFADIEATIADFAQRASEHRLEIDELRGGTFTITNGGVFGSLLSTPIVNPPQSGVLGMHTIQDRPVALEGQVVIRPMMYVALTYDHRIVDGREAVSFLNRIKQAIEQPARMLIEV